jgi:hypothetical protein
MARDDDADDDTQSPWELAGVERDGEFIPADSRSSGGVDRFVTSTDSLDPPD